MHSYKLGGEFRALLLVLVLLSRPEVVAVEKSTSHSVFASWKPILLGKKRWYHEYQRQFTRNESGWSVGTGWLISDRSCTASALLAHMDPRGLCLYSSWGCRLSFLLSAVKILTNKHLIWVFRELVELLSNLEEAGRNVDTMPRVVWSTTDWISKFIKVQVYSNNVIDHHELILHFLPLEALTKCKVKSSFYVEL